MPDRLHIPGERPRALRWTDQHSQSKYGQGVMLYSKGGEILDGFNFRIFRDQFGAWLETSDPDRARRAMGMMLDESLGAPDAG